MKYKDKNDFAEKVVNKIPYIQDLNIRVRVTEYSIGFVPIKGAIFHGGNEITASLMNHLEGIIDGLKYAYTELREISLKEINTEIKAVRKRKKK